MRWRLDSLISAGSMAIAVGVCSAVFWLIYALLLRPLSITRPGELVALFPVMEKRTFPLQYGEFTRLQRTNQTVPLEAFRFEAAAVGDGPESNDVWVDLVSGGYFELLGVRALRGRLLDRTDEHARMPVVVVGEEFWRARLGADTAIIGKQLRVGGLVTTVVGVVPRRFSGVHFARRLSVVVPLSVSLYEGVAPEEEAVTLLARRTREHEGSLASLDAAVRRCCLDSARILVQRVDRPLPRAWPGDLPPEVFREFPEADARPHLRIVSAGRGLTWNQDLRARWNSQLLLVAAGGVVLLITACANVSALSLSRAQARLREFAVRRALGAGWQHLFGLVFAEAMLLACVGGVVATLTVPWATRLIVTLLPAGTRGWEGAMDWRPNALAFSVTILIVIGSSLIISVVPALAAMRATLADRPGRRKAGHNIGGDILIGTQIVLAVVLVSLSALFVRTLEELTRDEGGYRTGRVVLTRVYPQRGDIATMNASYESIRLHASTLPGADGAALASSVPVAGAARWEYPVRIPASHATDVRMIPTNFVTPGFFATSGIGLAVGRDFETSDAEHSEPVAIVSEALARKHSGFQLGEIIELSSKTFRIVGVARNARYPRRGQSASLRDSEDEWMYVPLGQALLAGGYPSSSLTLVVRAQSQPATLAPLLLRMIKEQSPENRFVSVTTVETMIRNRTTSERLLASLLGLFASASLALLAVGVFGTVSRGVTLRTREIGVRIALGASPSDATWFVLKRVVSVAIAAAAVGALVALGLAKSIESQFFGVRASDPWVLGGAALALVIVAMAAAMVPSMRAASVQPAIALGVE